MRVHEISGEGEVEGEDRGFAVTTLFKSQKGDMVYPA